MALAIFTKQSYEDFPISADFSKDMATGETLISQTITAIDNAGDDATASILSTPTNDGATQALIRVFAGTEALSPYKVTFRVVTSIGNKWELDIKMKVKEL